MEPGSAGRTWSLVGRAATLALLASLVDTGETETTAAFVFGIGGIGKSSLLQAFASDLRERGLGVALIDGRDREQAAEKLTAALEDASDPIVLLDTFEQVPALGSMALAAIRDQGRCVVVAGRTPPDPDWLELGARLRTLQLGPLDTESARALVRDRGVREAVVQDQVTRWAGGLPLALAVASDAVAAGHVVDSEKFDGDGMLATMLLERLAGTELASQDREVIAVAAIARAVDARMLAGVLPGIDGDHAEAWLRSLTFAENLGVRVTLHERVRAAVKSALVAQDQGHERELRRRIADHLHARGIAGEQRLLLDLAELIDDDSVRWGVAPPPTAYRADNVLPGDLEHVQETLGAGGTRWWQGVRRWFVEAPEQVMMIRDGAGDIAGLGIWLTPERAPAWAHEDVIVGPWLDHAARRTGGALMLRDVFDLTQGQGAGSLVGQVGSHAMLQRVPLVNVRYFHTAVLAGDEAAAEFAVAMGHVHDPALDVQDGERRVRTYLSDAGAGGVLALFRNLVYRDLGLQPPPERAGHAVAADTVRDALRCFHDPVALAANPLARGGTVVARTESMRRLLRAAVRNAFGDSEEEQLQRRVVQRGYLDADGGHTIAQRELHVARSVYFRRLADAAARVGDYVREVDIPD